MPTLQIFFHADCGDGPVEVFHFLRLYEEGEQQGIPLSANKKPVLSVSGTRRGGGGAPGHKRASAGPDAWCYTNCGVPATPFVRAQEQVDEIVFVEPAEGFYRRMVSTPQQPIRVRARVGQPAACTCWPCCGCMQRL